MTPRPRVSDDNETTVRVHVETGKVRIVVIRQRTVRGDGLWRDELHASPARRRTH